MDGWAQPLKQEKELRHPNGAWNRPAAPAEVVQAYD